MLAQYCLLGYGLHLKFSLQLLMHSCTRMASATHFINILFAGKVSSSACGNNLEQALSTCHFLGVPVAPDKVHGPASIITFLDIEIGTNTIQLYLPESKVSANTKRVGVEVFMYQMSAIVSNL